AQSDWRQRFDRLEKEREGLEVVLARKSVAHMQSGPWRQADPTRVANALPSDVAFIDFLLWTYWSPKGPKSNAFQSEARLLAFILVRGRQPAMVSLGPVEPINKAVEAWRQEVERLRPTGTAAAELSRLLWQPLQKHLKGMQTVLIAPDGPVSSLP